MKLTKFRLVLVAMIIILVPFFCSAENFLLSKPQSETTTFTLRYLYPSIKYNKLEALSGVYDLSVSVPISKKLNLVAGIPYITAGISDEVSESGLGNLFAGIQYRLTKTQNNSTTLTAGVFVPIISSEKAFSVFAMGYFSDLCSFEKYLYNTTSFYAMLAHNGITKDGFMYGLELGATYSIASDNDYFYEMESELYINYGVKAGYRANVIDIQAELMGKMLLTESDLDLGERTLHMVAFGVQWNKGAIRPGVFYALHLKEYLRDEVSGVLGVKIDFVLKK